jgi:dsDNA-binding SOS-regulon protein
VLERDTPKNYLSKMEEEEEEKWNLFLAPHRRLVFSILTNAGRVVSATEMSEL